MKAEAVICAWETDGGAAFRVVLALGSQAMDRSYEIPGTVNQAEIQSARFALAALPHSAAVRITTDSYYLSALLERSGKEWVKPLHANIAMAEALRTEALRRQFEIMRASHPEIEKCRSRA